MTQFVISETLITGLKEGVKTGILLLILDAWLSSHDLNRLRRILAATTAGTLLLATGMLMLPDSVAAGETAANITMTTVVLFLVISAGAVIDSSGIDLLGATRKLVMTKRMQVGLAVAGTVIYFLPDYSGAILEVREAGMLREQAALSWFWAATGYTAVISGFCVMARISRGMLTGSFFNFPQVLLCGALLKILTGGLSADVSLIPPIQRGLMKFSHDFIHQTFVILMVPDHPMLKTTVWNFIGILFGPNLTSVLSLCILLSCPLLFIYHSMTAPYPHVDAATAAQRRMQLYRIVSDRRKKMVPVAIFIVVVFSLWFFQKGDHLSQLYIPKPKPVVLDKEMILIPVNDPTMNLKNGNLHTFSLNHQGEEIRLLVITRTNGSLAVCLDACEICPPEGYGQKESEVVCIYCNTPIPVDTLGEPGGCNPVPLNVIIDDKFVRIELGELLRKWQYVKSGQSKESVK